MSELGRRDRGLDRGSEGVCCRSQTFGSRHPVIDCLHSVLRLAGRSIGPRAAPSRVPLPCITPHLLSGISEHRPALAPETIIVALS